MFGVRKSAIFPEGLVSKSYKRTQSLRYSQPSLYGLFITQFHLCNTQVCFSLSVPMGGTFYQSCCFKERTKIHGIFLFLFHIVTTTSTIPEHLTYSARIYIYIINPVFACHRFLKKYARIQDMQESKNCKGTHIFPYKEGLYQSFHHGRRSL